MASSHRMLILSTLAFTVCFAAWMINGVLVTFLVDNKVFPWSPVQVGFLLGVPVLVGAVMRLPIGLLTDRFGGRWVISAILLVSAVPMFLLSGADSYAAFLWLSMFFGLVGSAFAAGVPFVSLWYPKNKQGTALGIFGAGNLGASLTTLIAPTLLDRLTLQGTELDGWRALPQLYAAIMAATGIIFFAATRNRTPAAMMSLAQRLAPLRDMRVWRYGCFYFLVFGGFVALAQWLIPYYVNVYSLSIVAAGFMATAFSLPSGLVRMVGGWLADRVGARKLLTRVFWVCLVAMLVLLPPRMEILAPGEGIIARNAGVVTELTAEEIVVDDARYQLKCKGGKDSGTILYYGVHRDQEDFLLLPNTSFWHEPQVRLGDPVSKGQLLAKGATHIYFQANIWIFFSLVFLIGIMMGMGSAAVFKHVAEDFPTNIGTVGGIVGVLGGLGGFFGPLLFGALLKATGVWTTCWLILAVATVGCIWWQRIPDRPAHTGGQQPVNHATA